MSLITITTQFLRRSLPLPSRRLILTYLTTVIALIGVSEFCLYFFILRNLEQQSNEKLLNLVEVAAPSLDIVKTEGLQKLDREGPWRNLFAEHKQSLEWFDSDGKLLAREGPSLLESSLKSNIVTDYSKEDFPQFKSWGHVRSVTIAVYTGDLDSELMLLEGYIRASESTEEAELIRNRLQLGLALGGALALLLISMNSVYLAQQKMMPVKQGLRRLKQVTNDVSHQLRTPLTRISMATEILLTHTDEIQPSDTRKLKIINDAVEQLKILIEDLLLLIRIDLTSNLEELEFSDVSLNLLLQNLKAQFAPLADSQSIDFQIQNLNDIYIKGNTAELDRMLKNFLENVFSYTESGGKVLVSVKLARETVIISIQDTGMGISASDLPLIFQPFWRGKLAKSKRPEGLGLGLTIARAIVQKHGGTIEVNSEPGQGSCFTIHLPFIRPKNAAAQGGIKQFSNSKITL